MNIIIIDAKQMSDLDLIASSITSIDKKVVYAGCSGLAGYLAEYLTPQKSKKINVVISGSASEVTRKQLNNAANKLPVCMIDIDINKLMKNERESEMSSILQRIRESSFEGKDVIVRTAPTDGSVKECFEKGNFYGFDRLKVSDIIGSFVGDLTRHIINEIPVRGFVFTGGYTAIMAAKSLGASGTVIRGEIVHGIPYGHFIEEQYKDIIIVSKAGGFGDEEAILHVLNFLKHHN